MKEIITYSDTLELKTTYKLDFQQKKYSSVDGSTANLADSNEAKIFSTSSWYSGVDNRCARSEELIGEVGKDCVLNNGREMRI